MEDITVRLLSPEGTMPTPAIGTIIHERLPDGFNISKAQITIALSKSYTFARFARLLTRSIRPVRDQVSMMTLIADYLSVTKYLEVLPFIFL